MGQKLKLISSIISLGVTLLLLICVCFAWYATNHDAKVSGFNGSVIDSNNLMETGKSVEYYDIISIDEDNVCRIGAKNLSKKIHLEPYDPLSANINQKLMIIPIAEGKKVKIKAVSKVRNYILGERNPSGQAAMPLNKANNSLSSIIGFYYIPELTSGSNTGITGELGNFSGYTFTLPTESSHFVTINENGNSDPYTYVNEVYITPSAGLQASHICILLGYYSESVEYIYTLNIGNENLNLDVGETISYESDFYITIEEA